MNSTINQANFSKPQPPEILIGFLGPQGTYSEEVILSLYQGHQEGKRLVPFNNISAVIKAVVTGQVTKCMVPIENSLEGSVNITADTLAHEKDLAIIREIVWPISHHLLVKKREEYIENIISHPQALAQCRQYLELHYPHAKIISVDSTSEAVYQVADGKKNTAAIGSSRAAKIYDLVTLASGIQDNKTNSTRFVAVVHKDNLTDNTLVSPNFKTDGYKTSIVCQLKGNNPGSLCYLLEEFACREVNLSRIESRPARTGLGQYIFFLDLEGALSYAKVRESLEAAQKICVMLKNLGSYPVMHLEEK